MKFRIVDAFTQELFGGNPAGVVMVPQERVFPSKEVMLKTAAELRYSETAFVQRMDKETFRIRYFTPAAEVDLCGHATIGTFYALLQEGDVVPGKVYRAQTGAGELGIAVENDGILMDMGDPEMWDKIPEGEAVEELYGIMGLEPSDQGRIEGKALLLPCQKVSTGLPDILMPVKDQDQLEKIQPDFPALARVSEKYHAVGVHAFTVNGRDGLIHARNFAPLYEIDEEAATGTSNGALAYYLYHYGLISQDKIITVVQGEKMKRPSRISAQISGEKGREKVRVGGFAVTLAQGEIHI